MLLALEAAIEGTTALALIFFPGVVVWLLFRAELAAIGIVMARVAGITLLALALACWLGRRGQNAASAVAGILTYNILTAAYLGFIAFQGQMAGILLWPAVVFHAVMSSLLLVDSQRSTEAELQK